MNWDVIATKSAKKALAKLSDKERFRILAVFQTMEINPFNGDIKHIENFMWRRRVGSYRIFYNLDFKKRLIVVTAIARRTTTTYS